MPTFPIDRYLNIRSATGPSFSPDGRFVSFLTNTTGVSQLWQVPTDGGWPVQLTFTGESVRGGWYSPTRPELIFAMDHGGNERTQLYRLNGVGMGRDHGLGDGWDWVALTNAPNAIHAFGGWSHDGEWFAFSANREDETRFDVYVQKRDGKEARLVAKGPGGYFQVAGWSPDDKTLLVSRMESNFNQDLYLIDVARGTSRHLTRHQGDVQYDSPVWSADGKFVWCATTAAGRDAKGQAVEERDLKGLAAIEVATENVVYVATLVHEVEAVFRAPKTVEPAYVVNVDGLSELHAKEQKIKLPGAGVVADVVFSRDGLKAALVFDGARFNPDLWLFYPELYAEERKLFPLTHADRAGIPFSEFVEPELIKYRTFDGLMIPAWFYKPRGVQGLPPVIVYPHGGPESQQRPNFNPLFAYFVAHGYAVLAPNVRGSTGYGTKYMNLDNTTRRMDAVNDLAHAAYWLRDEKQGDPKRLAVFGGSYGGFMVLAQVTHYPELWAAGIDVVGIANFVTFLERTGGYRRAHREAEYGNLREHREFFEKISPIHHVDKIRCPMMVIHGANDPRVPIHEAEQIVAALRKRQVPVEYLRYEDEGHGLAKLKNRLDAYPKMVAFLDQHVKGVR